MPEAKAPTPPRPDPVVPAEPIGMTLDELPVQVRLRVIHAERWVAWAADDQSAIAVADTYAEVRAAARRAGFAHALVEWVPPVPVRSLLR